jgi:arsenical pump membrane protein
LHAALAVILFVIVLVLVVWQPRGLSIGWSAAAGGLLALLLGIVSLQDVREVLVIVWDPTLTFVALILISLVLDSAGFFVWAALHMARASRGGGLRLFVLTLLLGAGVSAFFANDGAALILTPIVYEQVRALRLDRRGILAFVMAGGFIADATSLPLVVSNLVNILSADYFHIGFVSYAARMVPVDIAALLASLLTLYLLFRRDLPRRVASAQLPAPTTAIRDPGLFRAAWFVLALLLVGYLLSEPLHLPVSLVAGAAAVLLIALARRSPAVQVRRLLRDAPWRIVVFSVGMYLVVFGLRDAGLTRLLSEAMVSAARGGSAQGIFFTGYAAAVLSSVMNNLPTVMVDAIAIHAAHLPATVRTALALANVVGSDLGPKMTPIGSLATLLWLHVLARRGMRIGWGYYFRVGLTLTLPVLAATLAALTAVTLVHA